MHKGFVKVSFENHRNTRPALNVYNNVPLHSMLSMTVGFPNVTVSYTAFKIPSL